jgi:hypothetical protein
MTDVQLASIVTMIVVFITAVIGLRTAKLNNATAKINATIAMANAGKIGITPLKKTNNQSAFSLFIILNIFIVIAILVVSFDLYKDFHNSEPITRSSIFNTCFLLLLLVINMISLCMNFIYRHIGKYVDGLLDIADELFGYIKDVDTKHTAAVKSITKEE